MTTARAQAARIRALILIAALALLGCAASSKSVYSIDGATADFCVPRNVDVTPARPSQGEVILGGVTMNGCWRSERGECVGPENLIALSVTDKESFLGRKFKDFPIDAHVGTTANQERTRAKFLSGKLIAIPDFADAQKWFVWHVVEVHDTKMAEDDELEATCVENAEVGGYLCDRKVAGGDYLLVYSFVSRNELPTTFNSLDRLVLAEVDKFRCPKNERTGTE